MGARGPPCVHTSAPFSHSRPIPIYTCPLLFSCSLKSSATDVSAQATMKGVAKCDKHFELQSSVSQQNLERTLRFQGIPESTPTSAPIVSLPSFLLPIYSLGSGGGGVVVFFCTSRIAGARKRALRRSLSCFQYMLGVARFLGGVAFGSTLSVSTSACSKAKEEGIVSLVGIEPPSAPHPSQFLLKA